MSTESEIEKSMTDIGQTIREHVTAIQERCRAAGILRIREWKQSRSRILVGKMIVREVETLGDGAEPVEKFVYLNLADIEWQVREIIKRDGGKGVAMLPLSVEDAK